MAEMLKDKDILTGMLFVGIGGAFVIGAADYGMGTTRRMGPGYFPVMLGLALALVGLVLAARSAIRRRPDIIGRLYLRPVVSLTASILSFSALINTVGLLAACMVCTLVAGLATSETRYKEIILVAIAMTAFSAIVFTGLLGLPMRLWVQ
ncbi:tripartite tricarboxylate transporter TctB family protein [Rhodospirillaceae bacterium SYSU D60014]|uniref:tripartite tricarboxylate transporter TctB family protein n=1 Tax=Virgifigura deserti TaxID=2268457 RepID=UPI000E675A72